MPHAKGITATADEDSACVNSEVDSVLTNPMQAPCMHLSRRTVNLHAPMHLNVMRAFPAASSDDSSNVRHSLAFSDSW